MKKLLFALLLFTATHPFAQMKQSAYTSTYQIDKTLDGSKKISNHTAMITFVDPKAITNTNSDFENLPEGKVIIKYSQLKAPLTYGIKYFGTYSGDKNQFLYGISQSPTDYNTVIVMSNNKPSDKTKGYKYIILTANMNSENGSLITFTAYYCNLN